MLSQLLDEKAAANEARHPDEVNEAYAQGIEKSAKHVGDAAIDAQLSGWDGDSVTLSELWQEGIVNLRARVSE